jgi:uroporphyrinogen decarboxylase
MRRKRVIDAIEHKNTPGVPHNIDLTKDESIKVCDYLKINQVDFPVWAENHIEKFICNKEDVEIKKGFFKDEYGVIWNRTVDKDIGVVASNILEIPELAGYIIPEIDSNELEERLNFFMQNKRDSFKFAKIDFSLFERAWSLRGFENLLMDLLINRDFAKELLDSIAARNIKIIDLVLKHDFDGVYFGDDYGFQAGMLVSPELWRVFFKPCLKKMFLKVKNANKYTCLHSCGDISPILKDLIEIGLDIYQTVQPEIYDLKNIKKNFGSSLCFYGAISTQKELVSETPKGIKNIVRETIKILAEDGGYIAAPTHCITRDVPVENVIALAETFKNQ